MLRLLITIPLFLYPIFSFAGEINTIAKLITPGLATAKTDFEKALLLREQIHKSFDTASGIPVATTGELANAARAYRMSVLEGVRSNACNGKAILFVAALEEFGIDARVVELYSNKTAGAIVWSHSSVDVRIGRRWIAMDPTFNISFAGRSGVLLSWRQVVARVRAGKFVLPITNGQRVITGRSIEYAEKEKGYRLKDLVKYVLIGPWRGGRAENLTPGWDGKIRYMTGKTFDAWGSISSEFYRNLAQVRP